MMICKADFEELFPEIFAVKRPELPQGSKAAPIADVAPCNDGSVDIDGFRQGPAPYVFAHEPRITRSGAQ